MQPLLVIEVFLVGIKSTSNPSDGWNWPFILITRENNGTNAHFYVDDGYRLNYSIANDTWHYVTITLNSSNLWTFYVAGTSQGTYQDDATHFYQNDTNGKAENIYLGMWLSRLYGWYD